MMMLWSIFSRFMLRCKTVVNSISFQLPTAWNTMASDEQCLNSLSPNESSETCTYGAHSSNSGGSGSRLPVSLLLHLKTLVQEKIGLISRQILAGDVKSTSAPVTSDHNIDCVDSNPTAFKFPDLIECTGSSKKSEKCENLPKAKKQNYQSQDVRKMEGYPKSKKRKGHSLSKSNSEDCESPVSKRKRPNYFVAVQVADPKILDVAKKIQAGIQENSEADLKKAFVGLEKSHVTLMVMHLPNEEEVKKAAGGLDLCAAAISERTGGQPVILDFEGLSTFSGGRVLFASLKPTEGLDHLRFMADEVSKQMSMAGIFSTDGGNRPFNPHLTLMKFEGDKELRRQGINKVAASLYMPYVGEVFGAQTVSSLQLCRMNKKREDGYYFVDHEVSFCK